MSEPASPTYKMLFGDPNALTPDQQRLVDAIQRLHANWHSGQPHAPGIYLVRRFGTGAALRQRWTGTCWLSNYATVSGADLKYCPNDGVAIDQDVQWKREQT